MNDDVLCPVNPIGHEWDGLGCRWCPATRTPGEAIVSGLASRRGGDRDSARTLLDAHRAEVLNEAADMVHAMADPQCTCGGCDSCAARGYAKALREKATAAAATATPDEKFFVPGRVYTRTLRTGAHSPRPIHLRFLCRHIDSDPVVGDREAWGWVLRSDGTRRRNFFFDHDYPLWTIEAGDTRG